MESQWKAVALPEVEVQALFPVPFMRVGGLLPEPLVEECVSAILESDETVANTKSRQLRHSRIGDSDSEALYGKIAGFVNPHLVEFGRLLFGEALGWQIKEMWTNVLEPGGFQSVHSHSNSFASGIIYLTESHPSARTVFHRALGGRDFVFGNQNPNARMGPFNASTWVGPATQPGDLVLYPSYLLHEVPQNQGNRRVTLALNALPDRLDTFGYSVNFT